MDNKNQKSTDCIKITYSVLEDLETDLKVGVK